MGAYNLKLKAHCNEESGYARLTSASFNMSSLRDRNFSNFTEIMGKNIFEYRISSDFNTCAQDFTPVADLSVFRAELSLTSAAEVIFLV